MIFVLTFGVLAVGRFPGLRVDRAGAAVIGAAMMLAFGAITAEEAWRAIHYDTILLLFGMMIVVANLRLSGFFAWAAQWIVTRAHRPVTLLAAIVLVTGVLSAMFVNDTMCLVMTPLVLEVTTSLRRNPLPYLIGVAVSSNIGSVATITGNPQNMMIGGFSGVSFTEFFLRLAPVAAAGLVCAVAVLVAVYRSEFGGNEAMEIPRHRIHVDRPLLLKSLLASGGLFVAFFSGVPVAKGALIAGAILMITRRVHPEKIYRQIDWPLLVMFSGLFVVLAAAEKTSLNDRLLEAAGWFRLESVPILSLVSAGLSNLISNVPAVLLLKPVVERLPDAQRSWMVLAMSSTLAGNLTLLGSVANLIVAEQARKQVVIGFWEYTKVGIPVTILTLLLGSWWLS